MTTADLLPLPINEWEFTASPDPEHEGLFCIFTDQGCGRPPRVVAEAIPSLELAEHLARAAADRAPEGRDAEEPRHQGFTTHEAVQVALDNDLEGWEWLRAWWNADLADNDPQSAKYRADLDRFALKSSAKETE